MRKAAAGSDPVLPLSYFHVWLHVREIPSPLTMETGSQTHVNNAVKLRNQRPPDQTAPLLHISSAPSPLRTPDFEHHAQHPKVNVSIETSRLPQP